MLKRITLLLSVLLLGTVLAGCSTNGDDDGNGSGGSGPTPVGLSGNWYGEGFYNHDHDNNHLHMPFTMELNLTHSGTLVQGNYKIVRPVRGTMTGSVTGTYSGTNFQANFNPHGRVWGTATADTMSLTWFEDWGGGKGLTATITLGHR